MNQQKFDSRINNLIEYFKLNGYDTSEAISIMCCFIVKSSVLSSHNKEMFETIISTMREHFNNMKALHEKLEI